MDALRRESWIGAAVLVGLTYFIVGRAFAIPADHVQAWRLAAWFVSAAVYGTHIAYEHFRLRNPPRVTAIHAAVAVAIGACALAFAAMIHSLSTTSSIRPVWFLMLVLWPAITAIPAFLVALVSAVVLSRLPRRAEVP
jgi:hypothetical protein